MKILEFPNDSLRIKCKPVLAVTPELVNTAKDMYQVMREVNGIGLAAPQVGLDMRLIVLEDAGSPLIMINPHIIMLSPQVEYTGEGCLSFPGVTRIIKRAKEATVKYRDIHGKMQYLVLKGLQARCVIHELDHLQGRLFIDLEEKRLDK